MKRTYKLQNNYFNIEFIQEISEIEIINDYEQEEAKKKFDKEFDESNIAKCFKVPTLHIYSNYEKDCKTARIKVNGKEYTCSNHEREPGGTALLALNCKITDEKIKEFTEFISEAKTLLEAFKSL